MRKTLAIFMLLTFTALWLATPTPLLAQQTEGALPPERIIRPLRAVDPITLQGEGLVVRLWGIKPAQTAETPLELKALDLMDKMIGNEQVNCRIMGGRLPELWARCTTHTKEDLALSLLSQGYVVVDRRQIYNSVFASNYFAAQESARLAAKGVWQFVTETAQQSNLPPWIAPYIDVVLLVSIIFGPLGGLMLIALVLRAGFSRIGIKQEKEMEEARLKEEKLQTRERQVLLSTLEGELIENKNKIDAFLAIYKDMLRDLNVPDQTPKYQQVGDIVQKNPVYSRIVFETHATKMSLLDMHTAGMLSKFSASLPKDQAYVNLEPTVPLDTAIKLLEKIVQETEAHLPAIDAIIKALQAAMQKE